MIRKVNGWIPVFVFKKNPPFPFRGFTKIFGPFCWINIHYQVWNDRPEFEAILAHELQHASDFYSDFPKYWFDYHRKPYERFRYEARGYARQYLAYQYDSSDRLDFFAKLLHQRYDLGHHYSESDCFKAIAESIAEFEGGI